MRQQKLVLGSALLGLSLCPFAYSEVNVTSDLPVEKRLEEKIHEIELRMQALEKRLASSSVFLDKSPTEAKLGSFLSTYNLRFYGKVEFYSIFNNHGVNDSTDVRVPLPKTDSRYGSDRFATSANTTRFGVEIFDQNIANGKLTGKVEFDFKGEKDTAKLRHAYVSWESENHFFVTAGQTDEPYRIIGSTSLAPNVPASIDTRKMQLTVGQKFEISEEKTIAAKLGLVHKKKGESSYGINGISVLKASRKENLPQLQGILVFEAPSFVKDQNYVLALSGVLGKEKITQLTGAKLSKSPTVWLVGITAIVPLVDWLAVSGMIWEGQNLHDGNYGTLYNSFFANNKNVRTFGAFGQFILTPLEKWTFNIGCGLESAKKSSVGNFDHTILSNSDKNIASLMGVTRNLALFTNAQYHFTKSLMAGVEYMYINTKRRNLKTSHDSLIIAKVTFKF